MPAERIARMDAEEGLEARAASDNLGAAATKEPNKQTTADGAQSVLSSAVAFGDADLATDAEPSTDSDSEAEQRRTGDIGVSDGVSGGRKHMTP